MYKQNGYKVKNSSFKLKERRNKKILMVATPIVLVVLIITLIATGSLSKLSGNSVVSYYCEDSSYELEGTNCVKTIVKESVLLADINSDKTVDENDLNLLNNYVKSGMNDNFSELQFKVADINSDGMVNEMDVQILEGYFSNVAATAAGYSEKIGIERFCEDGYTLNGESCVIKETIPAQKKETSISSQKNSTRSDKSIDSVGSNSKSTTNPVIVTLKPENSETSIKVNTKYKMYVNFDIKDTSKQYYYIWTNYLYDEENYNTGCQKVTQGDHYGAFTMIGTRKVNVTVYSDSSCKTKVTSVDSKKYTCNGCTNMVDVSLKPQDNKTSFTKGTKYKMNVVFDIKDKENTYYYIWYNFLNGKNNYKTDCKKVTQGEHGGSFTIDGTRAVQVILYSDSSCKNKIKHVTSKTYTCTNCNSLSNNNKITINYASNGGSGSMESQKFNYGTSVKLSKNTFSKSNYYFIGWRNYNNNNKQWMCYKNSNKSSYGYTSNDNCKKYGYYIYRDMQKISTIASKGESITMYALWQYSYKNAKNSFKGFERDPKGATVWPMVTIDLYKNSNGTNKIGTIPQGTALKVIDMTNKSNSNNSFVKVNYGGKEGYINGWLTMINLPDVIPSVLYNITNASASIFKSRKYTLSGVTGEDIYGNDWKYSMAPIRIDTAKKIQAVSSLALQHGNKIKIYDSFRPWVVQRKVADAVKDDWFTGKGYTITSDFDSSKNTNGANQNYIADYKGWFIAIASSKPASHNLAKAIDVTLVFSDDNQEIPTQSSMHELSGDSIPTKQQVDNNKGELALNYLFTNSGFMFLPSEWWHFEDKQNANYSQYSNQIKCLGNPYSNNKYNCKVNQIKLAK